MEMSNGWWRIAWIATMTNNVGAVQVAPTPSGTGTASDINYTAGGTEHVYATGLQIDSDGLGLTSYVATYGATETRAQDVLQIQRANGTYDIAITRRNGVQVLTDQVISTGSFTIPVSTSPVIKVVTTRK
jgi:hypothetical protein